MRSRGIRRDERWVVAHLVLAFFVFLGVLIGNAAMVAAIAGHRFEMHAVLPYSVVVSAFVIWATRRAAANRGALEPRSRKRVHGLGSAWAETWKRVLVHSVGGSLVLSLFWTTSEGLGLQKTLILAAILFLPVFLCVVIFDVGGALAGDAPD